MEKAHTLLGFHAHKDDAVQPGEDGEGAASGGAVARARRLLKVPPSRVLLL